MLLILRSAIFNVLFYLNLLVHFLIAIPTLVLPRMAIVRLAQSWGRTNNWLLRAVCGIKVEYRGLEKIPPGALLVASKHQSLWETFALLWVFSDPAFILKRELQWIPFFGWYCWKASMIPVDRGRRGQALADMTERARVELGRGRQIVIFPEGTRRPPGAEPSYKFGIVHLYSETGIPLSPDRAQFRPVLAAPVVPALSRNHRRRSPRPDTARARQAGVRGAAAAGHRDRDGAAHRRGRARAGAQRHQGRAGRAHVRMTTPRRRAFRARP